jgi:ubiquinone/menaquinone biosynthesis C-methylase UbiE
MRNDWTRHWEENYKDYLGGSWNWRITRAYKKLLKRVDLKNPKVLELGSGTGINSLTIAKGLNATEITLVDNNKKAFEISRKVFEKSDIQVKFLCKNILNLNLSQRFDIVHSEGLIEHFNGKDRMLVFKKHRDFCRTGGFIIIFVPYKSFQYSFFKFVYRKHYKRVWEEIFTKEELRNLCNFFDLKIVKELTSPLMPQIGILAKK